MTFNPDEPEEHKKKWLGIRDLQIDTPVMLEVVKVTPQDSEDSRFYFDCKVHSGPLAGGDTVRVWWSRYRKGRRILRKDFQGISTALLNNKKQIHSFHFLGKYFWTTPKVFFAGDTLMLTTFKQAYLSDV